MATKNKLFEVDMKKEKLKQTSQDESICVAGKPELKENKLKERKLKERKLSEANIGKYALPIAATLLIMAGICVMAFMAWNFLSDWFKVFIVLAMAAGAFGTGYLFGKKERMATFRYVMYALGLSICYIDILLMSITWCLIPFFVTTLLIIAWTIAGFILSKSYQKGIYYHIVEVGVVITSFVIQYQMDVTIESIISVLVTIGIYWFIVIMYEKQTGHGNFMFGTYFLVLNALLLSGFSGIEATAGYRWLFECILLGSVFLFAYKKEQILFSETTDKGAIILSAISALWIPCMLLDGNNYPTLRYVETIIFLLLMLKGNSGRNIMIYFAYPGIALSSIFLSFHFDLTFSGLSILAIGILILYNCIEERLDILHFITSILCSFSILFFSLLTDYTNMEKFYITASLLLVSNLLSFFLFYKKRDSYIGIIGTTCCFLFNIGCVGIGLGNINGNVDLYLGISAVVQLLIFIILSILGKNRYTDRSNVVLNIISWLLAINFWVLYITRMNLVLSSILAIVIILNACHAVYLSDIWKNSRKSIDILYSLFITMNIMVLIHNTMIWDYTILLTLILMGISSGFILIGFRIKRKGVRLYGLTVLMLSVLKMILVDTTGNNPIVKVIAMIVGGIICLGISYLYNKLERRLSSEDVEY